MLCNTDCINRMTEQSILGLTKDDRAMELQLRVENRGEKLTSWTVTVDIANRGSQRNRRASMRAEHFPSRVSSETIRLFHVGPLGARALP